METAGMYRSSQGVNSNQDVVPLSQAEGTWHMTIMTPESTTDLGNLAGSPDLMIFSLEILRE
jgi:hypothetical protein